MMKQWEKKKEGFWGENCALHFMFCWNYLILTWAFPEVLSFKPDSHKDWKHRGKNPGGRIEAAWSPVPQLITHSALGQDQDMGSCCGVLVWYWTASRCRSVLGQHSLLINHPVWLRHSNTSICHDIWLDFSGNSLDPQNETCSFWSLNWDFQQMCLLASACGFASSRNKLCWLLCLIVPIAVEVKSWHGVGGHHNPVKPLLYTEWSISLKVWN